MFTKTINYVRRRIHKLSALLTIKRYERMINRGWEINLKTKDEVKCINNGILLMEQEARLRRMKELYALM